MLIEKYLIRPKIVIKFLIHFSLRRNGKYFIHITKIYRHKKKKISSI